MPTIVPKTIGPSAADFTTLAAWEAAAPADLVAVDQVWQGQVQNTTLSGLLTVAGTTTDATRYKELTTVAGASFRDNANAQTNALRYNTANGAAITASTGYAFTVTVTEDFFRMSNLQVEASSASGGSVNVANQGVQIRYCILEANAADGCTFTSANGIVANSLIVGRKASVAALVKIGAVSGVKMTNVTVVSPSDLAAPTAAIEGNYGTIAWKNCAIYGCTAVKAGSGTHTFTTCYTDVASPPTGCTTAAFNTSQFVATTDAARDFRLPSGSALIDVGTTDATDAATDIVGTTRPSGSAYDVGAWEFVAAGTNLWAQACL